MKNQLSSSKTYMLLVFFLLAITFDTHAVEITVGDVKINVPPYSEFSEISSISTETFEMFQGMCPPSNYLLAVFLTQDDVGRLLLGEPAILNRYMMVQSYKEIETLTLTKHQFVEIRREIRKQWDSLSQESRKSIDQMTEKAGDVFSDKYDIELAFKIGDIVPLGVDSETTSSITVSQLAKYNINLDGEDVESVMAYATTTLLVKGKVIYLYVYKQYQTEKDIEWVRKTTEEYTKQILSANETTWPAVNKGTINKETRLGSTTEELLADWHKINIPQVGTIDIPPTIEVKSEGYKTLSGVKTDENYFTIQQRGLNELRPEAHKLYVRIMVDTEIGKPGEYETLYSNWSLTKQELEEISEALKVQIEQESLAASAEMFKSIENNLKQMTDVELRNAINSTLKEKIPDVELKEMRHKLYEVMKQQISKNQSLKLIEWFPSTVEKINGMLALSYTYRRQLGNSPIVQCKTYIFQNYDRTHTLTMSYRESEKEIWEKDFPTILSSFRITNIQGPLLTSEISGKKMDNLDEATKYEDSIMEKLFGEYWFLSLLLSAILTWGIGLAPPILIRYAILRRPLPKKATIPIVVFFFIVNIVIFTALGSQSKTHGALFLVALASHYILHRGYSTWPRKVLQISNEENMAVEKN